MASVKIIFLDIPAGVAVAETTVLSSTFHDFTKSLSRMSGSVMGQIKGLGRHQLDQDGFNMSHGCWWYRIVRINSARACEADLTLPHHTKGEWSRLATLFAYDHLRGSELATGLSPEEGWIEVQHDLQKKRDESTAARARHEEKNWRSSIGHAQASPQNNNSAVSLQLVSTSKSVANTSNTSLHGDADHAIDKGSESGSPGSSTEHSPKPPRCMLIHLNENEVAEDATSRNHHPVLFAKFALGENHTEGLPTYTPRPGPFPAQIGKPPSGGYCAYEIRNDGEYEPESPTLDHTVVSNPGVSQLSASQASDSHHARYHGVRSQMNVTPYPQTPIMHPGHLQTSISLPDHSLSLGTQSHFLEPPLYHMQSAPAPLQNFAPLPWGGIVDPIGGSQPDRRSFSHEGQFIDYGSTPYQGTSYFGPDTYNPGGQPYRDVYQSQSMFRSSSSPTRSYQSSVPPLSAYVSKPAIRFPSWPPPPQDVLPKITSPRRSDYQYSGSGSDFFSNENSQIKTDATKEGEFPDLTTQSQSYHATYRPGPKPSHLIAPNQHSRSSKGSRYRSGFNPPSKKAAEAPSRMLLPGFGAGTRGTEAPTFATADDFSKSFDRIARGLDATPNQSVSASLNSVHTSNGFRSAAQGLFTPSNGTGVRLDPALADSPPQRYHNRSRHAKYPSSGKFSPPKPRMKRQHATNILSRYSRGRGGRKNGGLLNHQNLDYPALTVEYNHLQSALPVAHSRKLLANQELPDQASSRSGSPTSASNFSDDFNLNEASKKAKAKRKKAKRRSAKATDAVSTSSAEENAMKEREVGIARAARVRRRSSGRVETEEIEESDVTKNKE